MRLILSRSQKSTIMGKPKFILKAMADLDGEEASNVKKYRMGDTMLFTNLADRGKGILGAISRAIQGIEITVDSLVSGKVIECKNILEMIAIEEEIQEACGYFKQMLDTAAQFGGKIMPLQQYLQTSKKVIFGNPRFIDARTEQVVLTLFFASHKH